MAKRANPFLEDFVQQSKVHVGDKQFNNNFDRLKPIHEKTLKLLFNGAKKNNVQSLDSYQLDGLLESNKKKDSLRQLLLKKDGTLQHSKKLVMVKQYLPDMCTCGKYVTEGSCAYCEAFLCNACSHVCNCCNLPYCSNCHLIGKEDLEICISCYK